MINQAQDLIDAIKALPGHQVFPGNGCVVIAITRNNSVSQRSVWLNRSTTIQNLQAIIDAAERNRLMNRTLVHMGRVWRIIGIGAQRNGNTYCHLASLDEFRVQKNGRVPKQIEDWIDSAVVANAKAAA